MAAIIPDLTRRAQPSELPELMDDPCPRAELRACLQDLAFVNRTLLGYRPTLQWLDSILMKRAGAPGPDSRTWDKATPLRILDVGSGYGDTLRRIEHWAQKKRIPVQLTGLDLNPDSAVIAREASPSSAIRWVTGDVFAYHPPQPPHLVLSALFTHHLPDPDLVRYIQWMERNAVTGWFINDLSRNITPYRLFGWFSRLLHLHPFVQHDGPVSIARAFTKEDWQQYAAAAGLPPGAVEIRGHTPGRLCVSRTKPQ